MTINTVTVSLGPRSYPIIIGCNLLSQVGLLLRDKITSPKILLVSQANIATLYAKPILDELTEYQVEQLLLPDGETHKTLATWATILDTLVCGRYHRNSTVIALGGGIVGDITGFAAACYQRGIAWIQMPTTLLAQVDSAIGGKTAVNHAHGKNLIGAFHQPLAVISDINTLTTLPKRELRAGLAEVIKYGLIWDRHFFDWLDNHLEAILKLEPNAITYAITRSCAIKAEIVALDETEQKEERALLNLGHTFGHAIESAVNYQNWLHGEAVAVGLGLAAKLSHRLGFISTTDVARVYSCLAKAGLPQDPPELALEIWQAKMASDKKATTQGLRFVTLRALGKAQVTSDIPWPIVAECLQNRCHPAT